MIDTIIFDAEGVVVDTEAMWDRAQEQLLRRRGMTYYPEQVKPLLTGKSLIDGTEILKAEYGISGNTQTLAAERMELVQEQLETHVEFIDGFLEFFDQIRATHKHCIATAMPEDLLAIVDARLSLSDLFADRIYSIAVVGYRSKPHPDIFLHAARQIGSRPAHCLVIEDAPHGIEAARRAGMKSVGLTTTYRSSALAKADRVVERFDQIDLSEF